MKLWNKYECESTHREMKVVFVLVSEVNGYGWGSILQDISFLQFPVGPAHVDQTRYAWTGTPLVFARIVHLARQFPNGIRLFIAIESKVDVSPFVLNRCRSATTPRVPPWPSWKGCWLSERPGSDDYDVGYNRLLLRFRFIVVNFNGDVPLASVLGFSHWIDQDL